MLGGHLYNFCHFVAHGSEQMSSICIYVLLKTRAISIINNELDPTTVFPFGVDHQVLNVSRD